MISPNNRRWSQEDIENMIQSFVITIPRSNGGYSFYNQYRNFDIGELFQSGAAIYEVVEVSEDRHSGIARYVSEK